MATFGAAAAERLEAKTTSAGMGYGLWFSLLSVFRLART